MPAAVGLAWPPSNVHGWGVFGANFLREMLKSGRAQPLLLAPADPHFIDAEDRERFAPLFRQQADIMKQTEAAQGSVTIRSVCIVHALGNGLAPSPISQRFRGEPNVGFTFFETRAFPTDVLARGRWMDAIMAGSTWNADVLKGLGFEQVAAVFQGVEVEKFKPLDDPTEKTRAWRERLAGGTGGRFVVFSGGKFELRKGQDLVTEGFKRFNARHPDSLLATVWHNPWPQTMAGMAESPWVSTLPETGPPQPDAIRAWVTAQGVPEGAHVDLGTVANADMPDLLRACDAAVFPNRCEGGTNLVAMEALATGLPCVLSANSGHLDIIGSRHAYPLTRQEPVSFGPPESIDWRESDPDEIADALEAIYTDRQEAAARGRAAHTFMQDLSWEKQIAKLLDALDAFDAASAE